MRSYISLAAAIFLTLTHWLSYNHGKDVVQTKFNEYQEMINDQVVAAKIVADRERERQEIKYNGASASYQAASVSLDSALKRLRNTENLLRNCTVPVAGHSGDSVSTSPTNTTGTTQAASFGAGTFQSAEEFYEAALRDTLQCQRLIEFVR